MRVDLPPESADFCLNESPSEKEGKSGGSAVPLIADEASMKVPPKRKGNLKQMRGFRMKPIYASMKVPPKRKGNKAASHLRGLRIEPQ